jgi:hypothetical protein
MPNRETIAGWRAVQGEGMNSAVGEYTPEEFWSLLDDYEALRDAARPFADFVGRIHNSAPENMPLTNGSSMAGRQLTVGDFRRLAEVIE